MDLHRGLWNKAADQSGSVVATVAILMTALLGVAALVVDMGQVYVAKQRLTAIADAAALSGAQVLPEDPDAAVAIAQDYLQKNGVDLAGTTVAPATDRHHLSVNANRSVEMTLAKIIGIRQVDVATSATAWIASISGVLGAEPLGVPYSSWSLGDEVYLKMAPSTDLAGPGNYDALALGRSGAAVYENNMMYGYQDWLRVDQWVSTEPGNMAGPTVRAVNYRISQDPYATYDTVRRNSPRLVQVPILESSQVNGRGEVHVIGFGVFFLEQGIDQGNDKGEVIGRFVRLNLQGEGSNTAPDLGAYTVKLTH